MGQEAILRWIPLIALTLAFIALLIEVGEVVMLFKKKKQIAVITPEDLNKDPSDLRNKMDKVWLKLEGLDEPKIGIDLSIDHKAEINAGMDEYVSNMRPFVVISRNDLDMPKDQYVHLGYYLQGDFYDLDATILYSSKRWVSDLNKHLPFPKKGLAKLLDSISFVQWLIIACIGFLLLGATCAAGEPQVLNQGDTAPFTGILLPEGTMKSIKMDLIDLDSYKRQAELYKQSQEILTQQANIWQTQSNNLSQQLVDEKTSFWGRASYFLAGAGITVALAFATRNATR